MKKLMLLLISVWLFAAGCIYYPYQDSTYNYDTYSGYNYPYGNYYPYYSYPYYYYPYYYPWWGHRYYYGPRRWR
jgi:hypothetical protein